MTSQVSFSVDHRKRHLLNYFLNILIWIMEKTEKQKEIELLDKIAKLAGAINQQKNQQSFGHPSARGRGRGRGGFHPPTYNRYAPPPLPTYSAPPMFRKSMSLVNINNS